MAIKGFEDTDCIENIMEKREIAHFPQCFPEAFFFIVLKLVYMEERVKKLFKAPIFAKSKQKKKGTLLRQ